MKKLICCLLFLLTSTSILFAQSTQVDVSAVDLGINSLSVPASGSVFGNEIDARGFSSFSVYSVCVNSGPSYELRWRIFDADGVVQTGGTVTTAVPGVGTTTVVSNSSDPIVFVQNASSGTFTNPNFKIRGPFRKIQLGIKSNGQALTCTATLIMQ